MQSEEVEMKNGQKKVVYAGSKEDLASAVKAAKAQETVTYPNINVPVMKGHDLVEVQPDLSVKLVDGTGAHNSPFDAVPSDGQTDPEVPVLGMDEKAQKEQGDPGSVRPTTDKEAEDNLKANTPTAADTATA